MKKNTKMAALGGILLAATVVILLLTSVVPGIELTLCIMASVPAALMVVETGVKGGWIFYLASVLASSILVPNKGCVLLYAALFGLYAPVKYHIEMLHRRSAELFLKLLFFNLSAAGQLWLFGGLFFRAFQIPDGWPLVVILLFFEFFFLLYDYVFTLVLQQYCLRFRGRIRF